MSTTTQRPTPEVDSSDTIPYMDDDILTWWVKKDFARKLERERDEAREQLEAMREAIREVYEALMLAPYRDQEALAKLQPFLKP